MAFLAKHRKEELIALADDMGIEISTNDKKIDICKKVKDSPDFEEEFVRGCLEEIVRQREELKAQAQAEAAELKAQAEAAELKRIEALRQEREFELEKMRISNAAEVNSVASTRSENSKNRLSLKNLMQKFDAQVSDISMYLALFERQARTAEIKRMLDLKIIEIGQSDYTSPMILVETVGREPRPCIDYRRLNSSIGNQYFPLPNIEERVERVSAAKFITVIDLAKGYWQIPLSKRAQRYAAFVTNFVTYVPLRMPFGLVNAPYFFSKLMSQVLENCESFAVPYLDDIAIYSNNWEDHLKHANEVLKRIGDANLTIKPSKCKFAQNRTKYLGHVVGSGIRTPAEAKIKAVLDFPTPTSKTQIRAFLGLAGYYAHYVKNFSVIAAPLTNVLKGKVKRESIIWTKECNHAFEELKRRLTKKPVLYAPDYKKEFIIQSDASDLGMGVVLSQRDAENEEHPVLYLSKTFSDAERKYSATERECAAIIYAIKKLKYYLDGQIFTIETDHNPLGWLKSNAGSNPRLMRWSLELQPFQYRVIYKAGKKHSNADALSQSETKTKSTN
ncbi:Retrovirus-related Pol polyprotein from transposon 297 [Araneus ventricosus]|uniref:RNA-directed DNA polymerase n=1 Tax=Araneus ventricosus TaxID=182803 RepID=A0A4Y1ZNZ2_ARAVE|nr:Retrovirus-related Pol polyprotein from transposon 297 [Araneus ventricosus]GBL60406.1 Retrovirus-related Pol polyprotein from transposon 297 [Araneus ventricosus]